MYCAVAWFVVEADELEFVASIVDIRNRRFRRVVFGGIDEGDWVIALAPEMGAFHELHRSRLFRDIVEGEPKRDDVRTLDWPIGEVVMPDRRLVRAWFFNKKLIEDDIDLCRPHDLFGDLGRGGTIDKLFESVVLMPQKGVAEKAAMRRILREFIGEFAWISKDEIGPLLQHGYPFGVKKSLQVHNAICFKCGDFGVGDVSDK